jgi:hypothetical protein
MSVVLNVLRVSFAALALSLTVYAPVLGPRSVASAQTGTLPSETKLAEAADFATLELGNPWDMTETETPDVDRFANVRLAPVTAGFWAATSTTTDPHLFLLSPGYQSAVHWKSTDGTLHPIDTSRYHTVSFRMYLDQVGPRALGQFFWFYGTDLTQFVPSQFFRVRPGWNIYTFDLRKLGTLSDATWTGSVRGFRLDPTNEVGVRIQLDWVRLTGDSDDGSLHTATWDTAQASLGALVDIYCDTDLDAVNGFDCTVAENVSAARGSYEWNTNFLSPGVYFIHSKIGSDYAALKLGDPWDMSGPKDGTVHDVDHVGYDTNGLTGVTTGHDPQIFLHVSRDTPIEALLFRRLSFQLDIAQSERSHVYVFWYDEAGHSHGTLVPQVGEELGTQNYSIDLGAVPAWHGRITQLRIDPGARPGIQLRLANVKLTTQGQESRIVARYADTPLRVNAAPRVEVLEPSRTSGESYAAGVLNNPWDMSDRRDISSTVDLEEVAIANGVLTAKTNSTGDPRIYLNTDEGRRPIDAERYRFLTYRFYLEGEQDIGTGWVTRWIWSNNGEIKDFCTSDDIVVEPGWYVYSIDLASAPTEPDDPRACLGSEWSKSKPRYLRFDPDEMPEPMRLHLDEVTLTAVQEVDASLTIRWELTDADRDDAPVIDLFWLADPIDPNPLVITRSISGSSRSHVWDTRAIAPGVYYVQVVVRDGLNTTRRVSSPVVVRHQT